MIVESYSDSDRSPCGVGAVGFPLLWAVRGMLVQIEKWLGVSVVERRWNYLWQKPSVFVKLGVSGAWHSNLHGALMESHVILSPWLSIVVFLVLNAPLTLQQ